MSTGAPSSSGCVAIRSLRWSCTGCFTRASCAFTSWRCAPAGAGSTPAWASPSRSTIASRPRSPRRTSSCAPRVQPTWTGLWTSSRSAARDWRLWCSRRSALASSRGRAGPRRIADSVSATGKARGALALVLHTHMPYVEGFGTWPFGEEWLWEAIAGCYLPLLDLLDTRDPPVTLSITPVLCDQLGAPGLAERFQRFVRDTRRFTHAEDASGLRAGGHPGLAGELERAWSADYEHALGRMSARGGDLLRAFALHVRWTSAATHAVLPLLATDACARLQVQTGVASHRDRFDDWRGGFWLPECAHAAQLEPVLVAA